jgi:hypothetical protein
MGQKSVMSAAELESMIMAEMEEITQVNGSDGQANKIARN